MNKRFLFVLIGIMAAGLIAIGCGDDDDDGGESDEPTTEQEATTSEDGESEDADSEEGEDTGDASGSVDGAVEAAVDACRQSVSATPGLSDDTVTELEDLCEEAASGDIEDAQAAAEEVCITIAEETAPSDDVRETAVAACESIGG